MSMEIKKSVCSVCSAGCAMDVWVEDGVARKVEPSNPQTGGQLCVKGYGYRDYVYRADRIQTPMRRVGPRGSGQWEAISWEEAYQEIAEKLLNIRAESGADAVAFFTGYSKWYRPVYQRLVHAFGTQNYATESSACFQSMYMANLLTFGTFPQPDMMHADLFIGWAYNPFYSGNTQKNQLEAFRKQGGRVLIIDPRLTPTARFADILLRPNSGTDGALALFFAHYLIEQEKIDLNFIRQYVHGFPKFKAYVRKFTLEKTAEITNIPSEKLLEAAQLIAASPRFCIQVSGAAIPHHVNGMQNCRAILSLLAITGNFDRPGGNIPTEYPDESQNQKVLWTEFVDENRPRAKDGSGYPNSPVWKARQPEFDWTGHPTCQPKIGTQRFPLWSRMIDEAQSMDLGRQILEGTPYPIRAVFALGMNRRMFPENDKLMQALQQLDFFVDVDLFWTDAAKVADLVLPACSSWERAELVAAGPMVRYVSPAIQPLYQSKSDVDILCELAGYLNLEDPILRSGYDGIVRHVLRDSGLTLEELKSSPKPLKLPKWTPYRVGESLQQGLRTQTGKIELFSTVIAEIDPAYHLNPLPSYRDSLGRAGKEKYPMILTAGGRIPTAFHSRYHDVKSARFFRPEPAADLSPADARALGIQQGDPICITTPWGCVHVRAEVTNLAKEGVVFLYQDYESADVNRIISRDHLDPYSGFPGYRSVRCRVEKEGTK
jgi:anaerobic selenocysteine-containing dehydrogenase